MSGMLNVKHVLVEYLFRSNQKSIFQCNSLSDLFDNVKMDDVWFFLRQGCTKKYELKPFNRVQTNEILLV